MKKIDRETVQRILDAADIVEVVSDFVSLKKRGANYIGLCPFHNERTPSFSVSRARGICKCFSCGKGGSPVNFIMEHEQMTFNEALRYIAKKYNIEVREHEMTDKEREEASERESLLAVNDFAIEQFQHNLTDTDEGRDIGLAYFRERGINDLMIKRFRLGYSLEKSDALYSAAIHKGFQAKALIDTGLCLSNDRGMYDRFRARVMFPVFSVSGRVIAFGGRTLRKDKSMAKYVNSPESIIYHKNRELYGLYQAKSSIVKQDKCILVEGYMDVISMHQAGVENVVASSGTSLTDGQIRLIHRFTQNVTVIYDSDAAGIKASLRGIDMLLSEGLNIKVLLLPDGDDPDSFAQSHSASEVTEYIKEHETDFIRFKTDILLKDAGDDPLKRARVISDIVRSIACIPDNVTRAVYLSECSRMLTIDEKVLSLQLTRAIAERAEKKATSPEETEKEIDHTLLAPQDAPSAKNSTKSSGRIRKQEYNLLKYIVRYGLVTIAEEYYDEATDESSFMDVSVIDFVNDDLVNDGIEITDEVCNRLMQDALEIQANQWPQAKARKQEQLEQKKQQKIKESRNKIMETAKDVAQIEELEKSMIENIEKELTEELNQYTMRFLSENLLSSPDDQERLLATELANEKYHLSKVHTKYTHIETEAERLTELLQRALHELKFEILDSQIAEINAKIKANTADSATLMEMLTELKGLYELKSQFAKFLGDRIVNPK